MSNSAVGPLSCVLDSIICENTFLGALVRTSNYRLDGQTISIIQNSQLIDTNQKNFGTIIGKNTQIGIGVIIYPGRFIGNNILIEPNIVIKKNISDNRHLFLEQPIKEKDL